jgi:hypothetical protein
MSYPTSNIIVASDYVITIILAGYLAWMPPSIQTALVVFPRGDLPTFNANSFRFWLVLKAKINFDSWNTESLNF